VKALEIGNKGLEEILKSDFPPKMKLYRAIIRHVELITKEFVVGSLRQQELLLPKHMYERVVKERDKFEKMFMEIFEDAVKELNLNEDQLKIRAYTILGAINWIPRWYSSKRKLSATQIGEIMGNYLVGKVER
jgi:TetR/AcrR family transcriptional regulator